VLVQNVSVARLANSLGGQKSPDGFRFDLENSGTPTSNITIINVDIGNVSPFWRYREQSVSALLDSNPLTGCATEWLRQPSPDSTQVYTMICLGVGAQPSRAWLR